MWDVIGNIASICSIIALPIAIWQIFTLKSRVEATEKGIRDVLDIKEYKEFEQWYIIVMKQYQEISELIYQVTQKGKSIQVIRKRCIEISKEISRCIAKIPSKYSEVLICLESTVEHIENFVETDLESNAELKEARDYLNNAIQQMKQEKSEFERKTVALAAHYND